MLSGHEIQLSVKELIEFSAREGDLVTNKLSGPSSLEGQQGHHRIQRSRNQDWEVEYRIKELISYKHYSVVLQGRIDLVNTKSSPHVVEEIKTTYFPPIELPENQKQLHWAQAKVYGFLYLREKQREGGMLDRIQVCVSWYDLIADALTSETKDYTLEALSDYVKLLIATYIDWVELYERHRRRLLRSAKNLLFPHPHYRFGQREFARCVFRALRDGHQLLAEAPTGTGKTVSTVFPAIKAMGEGIIDQVCYLTNKGSAQNSVLDLVTCIREQDVCLDYVVLKAKEKACPCLSKSDELRNQYLDEAGRCKCTLGFFDRLPKAREDWLMTISETQEPSVLQNVAGRHQLCPFELSLHLLPWTSFIVGDVNYVFDPLVRQNAFEHQADKRALLIDELHNFPQRARQMFSAEISSKACRYVAENCPTELHSFAKRLKKMSTLLTGTGESGVLQNGVPSNLVDELSSLLEYWYQLEKGSPGGVSRLGLPTGLAELINDFYRFLVISELVDDKHVVLFEKGQETLHDRRGQKVSDSAAVKIVCLDASRFLAERYRCARALIGFSATLRPMSFFHHVLGMQKEVKCLACPPVFTPSNQLTLRCDYVDTRWRHREASIAPIIDLVDSVRRKKAGKYLVFLPSYHYLQRVASAYLQAYPDANTVTQIAASLEAENEAFLNCFFQDDEPIIGFAVLGGIFSEGVDYIGDSLSGVIVVGAGMPQPSIELAQMEQYYQKMGLDSFRFTYQVPGFTRVLQAVGRLIRSEMDRGVVALVDNRFRQQDYQGLVPESWRVEPCSGLSQVSKKLDRFWSSE